jgi:lipoprotein-anchoring transpeptidase ErfK/SrfK
MKKRLVIFGIVILGLVAVLFLFMFKKSSPEIKGEPYQKAAGPTGLLYNEAEKLTEEGKFLEAKKTYEKLLTEYPADNLAKDAKAKLDNLNIKILFSPIPTEDSIFYEVKPGDALEKIARNFGTTVELIMKSNNLANAIIRPKMKLKISNAKYSVLVDKSQNILMLKANDEVLKAYTVSTGANNSTPIGTYKVKNKLVNPTWYKAAAVVQPGSPENILGSRWIGLDIAGYGIHGTTDEATIGQNITAGCVRMKNSDVEELYSIVPTGTEVTIID